MKGCGTDTKRGRRFSRDKPFGGPLEGGSGHSGLLPRGGHHTP